MRLPLLHPLPPRSPNGGPETLAQVLAETARLELQPGRLVTDVLSGGFRSTFRGGGVEFSDVREYSEGDDPRAVDWNVTARMGRPFVKRFVEERERTIVFVLDLSAGMAAGLGAWSLRQAAARFCACVGLMAIDNHDRVGLIAGSGAVERFVLPRKGAGHVLRVLRDCVELPLGGPEAHLDVLLARAAGRLRRRCVVFVLSPFAGEQPLHVLPTCSKHHDVVAVHLLARELVTPPTALIAAIDPSTGRRDHIDLASPRVRTSFLQRVQRWRHTRREQFGRAGVDVIPLELPALPDVDAIATPLLRFFRKRELRQVRR